MTEGKISVELKLELAGMREQLRTARTEIQKAVGGTAAGSGSGGSPKITIDQQRTHGIAGPGANIAMGGGGMAGPAMKAILKAQEAAEGMRMNRLLGLTNESGPASQSKGSAWKRFSEVIMPITAGLVSLRVGLGLISYAFRMVSAPLKVFARVIRSATEAASGYYAKALQSGGLPTGFIVKRSILAQVLGVSEDDVIQYGAAVNFVNKELESSINIQSNNIKLLTESSYKWKTVGQDMKAAASNIATIWKGVTDSMADSLHKLLAGYGKTSSAASELLMKEKYAVQWRKEQGKETASGLGNFFKQMSNFWPGKSDKVPNYETKRTQILDTFKDPEFLKNWEEFRDKMGAPDPVASAKRFPTSAWEKMGLVIGTGAGTNYSRDTAKNTAKTAEAVISLAKMFGMSPSLPRSGGLANMP